MAIRTQQAIRMLLALWLVVSVLVAGGLVHLPELHAKLHCEGSTSCCAPVCGSHHNADHEDRSDHPHDHQCLAELLTLGIVDAPLPIEFVPAQFVALSEAAFLEHRLAACTYSSSALPGRAPPVC